CDVHVVSLSYHHLIRSCRRLWDVLYSYYFQIFIFFFSSRRRHTRSKRDWSSDVCSSDLRSSVSRRTWSAPRRKPRHPRQHSSLQPSSVATVTVNYRSVTMFRYMPISAHFDTTGAAPLSSGPPQRCCGASALVSQLT